MPPLSLYASDDGLFVLGAGDVVAPSYHATAVAILNGSTTEPVVHVAVPFDEEKFKLEYDVKPPVAPPASAPDAVIKRHQRAIQMWDGGRTIAMEGAQELHDINETGKVIASKAALSAWQEAEAARKKQQAAAAAEKRAADEKQRQKEKKQQEEMAAAAEEEKKQKKETPVKKAAPVNRAPVETKEPVALPVPAPAPAPAPVFVPMAMATTDAAARIMADAFTAKFEAMFQAFTAHMTKQNDAMVKQTGAMTAAFVAALAKQNDAHASTVSSIAAAVQKEHKAEILVSAPAPAPPSHVSEMPPPPPRVPVLPAPAPAPVETDDPLNIRSASLARFHATLDAFASAMKHGPVVGDSMEEVAKINAALSAGESVSLSPEPAPAVVTTESTAESDYPGLPPVELTASSTFMRRVIYHIVMNLNRIFRWHASAETKPMIMQVLEGHIQLRSASWSKHKEFKHAVGSLHKECEAAHHCTNKSCSDTTGHKCHNPPRPVKERKRDLMHMLWLFNPWLRESIVASDTLAVPGLDSLVKTWEHNVAAWINDLPSAEPTEEEQHRSMTTGKKIRLESKAVYMLKYLKWGCELVSTDPDTVPAKIEEDVLRRYYMLACPLYLYSASVRAQFLEIADSIPDVGGPYAELVAETRSIKESKAVFLPPVPSLSLSSSSV
jgi:hypothetical protein